MRQKLLKMGILWKKVLYCFLAILIVFPLNLLITPLISATDPTLNDAKAICDGYASQGKTVVMFPNKLIQDYQLQSGPVQIDIPAGAYEVRAISQDGYNGRSGDSQPKEQWYAILSNSGNNNIATTGTSSDLDDSVDYVINDEIVDNNLIVSMDVTSVTAYHIKEDPKISANSVYPVCAVFDPIIQDNPDIAIIKTANPTTLPAGGGSVVYTYTVTNPGNVPLSNVVLTDDKCSSVTYVSGDDNSDDILETTETWIYACDMNLTATTTNVATVTGEHNTQTVQADDDATVTVSGGGGGGHHPAIRIIKTPEPRMLPLGGGEVIYTYVVTNPGYYTLSNVTLVDDKCDDIKFIEGDENTNDKLERGEIWKYTCQSQLTETTINTVVVTGESVKGTVKDTTKATVSVPTTDLAIRLEKTANPESFSEKGGLVVYSYEAFNEGTKAISDVTLTDDKCAPVIFTGGDANSDNKLDPTEMWTYTCESNITKTTTNTGTVRGQVDGKYATDTSDAIVRVERVKGTIPKEMPETGRGEDAIAVNNNWQQILFVVFALLLITVSKPMYKRKHQ